jgi:hypothetical protein
LRVASEKDDWWPVNDDDFKISFKFFKK